MNAHRFESRPLNQRVFNLRFCEWPDCLPYDELSDLDSLGLPHDDDEGCHEEGLEGVVGKFISLQELHR